LEIYLEPNPNFSENAKAPTPYQKSICP